LSDQDAENPDRQWQGVHRQLFTDSLLASRERQATGKHAFDQLCQALSIEHRLTKPRTPQTNGMVERFNGRIADVLRTHQFTSGEDLEQTLMRYVALYNHQLPQSALKSKTPMKAMKDWYASYPHLFVKRPYDHSGCNTLRYAFSVLSSLVHAMKNFKTSKFASSIALMLVLALSACGGSGGSNAIDEDPNAETPESSIVLQNTDSISEKISADQAYNISLKINNTTSESLLFELNWGDGSEIDARTFDPGEHDYTRSKNFNVADTTSFEWQARLLSSSTNEEVASVSGSVLVEAIPSAPVLQLLNTPPANQTNAAAYRLEFEVSDKDGDLAVLELKWADESAVETQETKGTTANASFARSFTKAGTYSWTALARDAGSRDSETLNGSVKVTMVTQPPAPNAPSLALKGSANSTALTQTTHELAFDAADKDGDLQVLRLRWSDETADRTLNVSTAAASVKLTRAFSQAGTFTWSARVSDVGGRTSTPITGQVIVTAPPPTEEFPLPVAKTLDSVPLMAAEACTGADNNFFIKSAPNPETEKRRRYVFDQFLVAKADKKGYDPDLTFKLHTKKDIHKHIHAFGLIALMFNQMKLTTDPVEKDKWRKLTNALALEATPQAKEAELPFKDYQIMDTYARWHCEMDTAVKTKIEAYIRNRRFDADFFNTSNLTILNAYSRYMAGLFWTDLKNLKNSTDPTGIKLLKSRARGLYPGTSGEWGSAPYDGYNTFVHMSLAQLSPDRELATLANLAFQATTAKTASVWMQGLTATFSLRDYGPFKTEPAGGHAAQWFFLGGKSPSFVADGRLNLSRSSLVGAAANYHMPVDITAVANKKDVVLETKIRLTTDQGKAVHSQSYVEKNFAVYSLRQATRDGSGKSFIPGQTIPPGVVWSPKLGRSNFWLTLTDDADLSNPSHSWGNTATNLIHAKYGQQWLQNKGTLLLVTDSVEINSIKMEEIKKTPSLQNIFGSMPSPNSSSLIDTSCATNSCKKSIDDKPLYQLFYSRDNKVLISITSTRPFVMFGRQRTTSDWQNEHGFKIPLDVNASLASGVAVETTDYATYNGSTMELKLANFKKDIVDKTTFHFKPPTDNKKRANLEYKDRLGNTLMKEYIWSDNAPYWRTKGWSYSKNPDPRPLEIINGNPVDHTMWPSIENSQVVQKIEDGSSCPLYVRKKDGNGWLKIWDDTQPPYIPKAACKAPA
jgi:Integrase core domain